MRTFLRQGKAYLELTVYLEGEFSPPDQSVGDIVSVLEETSITGVFATDPARHGTDGLGKDIFDGLTGPAIDQLKKNLLAALDEDTIQDAFA